MNVAGVMRGERSKGKRQTPRIRGKSKVRYSTATKTMTNCDTCGVRVSTTGYLGGGIVCHDCSEYKRTGDVDALRQRIERYGGGADWDEADDIQELLY